MSLFSHCLEAQGTIPLKVTPTSRRRPFLLVIGIKRPVPLASILDNFERSFQLWTSLYRPTRARPKGHCRPSCAFLTSLQVALPQTLPNKASACSALCQRQFQGTQTKNSVFCTIEEVEECRNKQLLWPAAIPFLRRL